MRQCALFKATAMAARFADEGAAILDEQAAMTRTGGPSYGAI